MDTLGLRWGGGKGQDLWVWECGRLGPGLEGQTEMSTVLAGLGVQL